MPRTKKTTTPRISILIIIREPGCEKWREYIEHSWFFDHIFFLTPEDLRLWPPIPTPISHLVCEEFDSITALRLLQYRFQFDAKVGELSICVGPGSSELVDSILVNLADNLDGESNLNVAGCTITNTLLEKTLAFKWVTFQDCDFVEDWWSSDTSAAKATLLHVINCRGKLPDHLNAGQFSWPSLDTVYFWERRYSFETRLRGQNRYEGKPEYDTDPAFTAMFVTSVWHSGISSFLLDNGRSADFLMMLPTNDNLTDLDLPGTPIRNDTLAWICSNPNIEQLGLAWYKDERLDWSKLKRLKKIRWLKVTDTIFDDEDLQSLAKNKIPLRQLNAYYSGLTAKSWKQVLTWRSLRCLWVSQHMMKGDFPIDLPDQTNLREVVALNARVEDFKRFLAHWPAVEVVEM